MSHDADESTRLREQIRELTLASRTLAAGVETLSLRMAALIPRAELDRVEQRLDERVITAAKVAARRRRLTVWLLLLGIALATNFQGIHTVYCLVDTPSTLAAEVVCEMTLPVIPDIDQTGAGGSSFDARPIGLALYLALITIVGALEMAVRLADRYRHVPDEEDDES